MGIQIIGPGGGVAEVNATYKALRTAAYPPEALGYFRASAQSGIQTGTGAAASVFHFRNADVTKLVVLAYLRVRWQTLTAFTAAQEVSFKVFVARSWSVLGSTGGTVLAGTAGGFKKRTSSAASIMLSQIVMATTGAVTGATQTLDTNEMVGNAGWSQTGAAPAVVTHEIAWDLTNGQDAPVVLVNNEGLVVQNVIALGVAGTGRWTVDIAWFEATAYP